MFKYSYQFLRDNVKQVIESVRPVFNIFSLPRIVLSYHIEKFLAMYPDNISPDPHVFQAELGIFFEMVGT